MYSAVVKIMKVGKIHTENELDFNDAFAELPDKLTFEEAEIFLNIFEENDDDDHSAIVWVWLELMKQVEGIKDLEVLHNSKVFWVRMLAGALERKHNARKSFSAKLGSCFSFQIFKRQRKS
jgi:hypothetical protein